MTDMYEWDDLSEEIKDTVGAKESIIKLLHRIAEKIDAFDYTGDQDDVMLVADDMTDMALALRAKAEELADAILSRPMPKIIPLPDES